MLVPPFIFRESDVRGAADEDLRDDTARAIGETLGRMLDGREGKRPRLILGRDCRLSSPRLHAAVKDGLLASGADLLDVGAGPTPLVYFAVHHLDADGGVMVTGSHNPPADNGFKVMRGRATFTSIDVQELRTRLERGAFPESPRGSWEEASLEGAYVTHLTESVTVDPRLRVVVDAGNGAGGPLALATLRALGLDPDPLFCEMDGRFPNHHPDPSVPANLAPLIDRVRATGARVGIAYDGDADRLGAVDASGEIVWGDRLMILFARDVLARNPGAAVVGEVKCSQALFGEVARLGGRPIMWKAGHSLIRSKMVEERALLAGEMSGHLFFADRHPGYDDAIYASLRLLEILSRDGRAIGEMLADVPRSFATPELRLSCPDAGKLAVVRGVTAHYLAAGRRVVDIDGARIDFGVSGADGAAWGLVRASTTGPELVLRFEADTAEECARIRAEVLAVVDALRGNTLEGAP